MTFFIGFICGCLVTTVVAIVIIEDVMRGE